MRNILKQGLRKITGSRPERPHGNRNAVVLTVAARKGGVGKTTTAVNLAAALARFHGKKVLLLDLDAQNNVALALASQLQSSHPGVAAVFVEKPEVDLIDLVVPTQAEGLYALAPSPNLGEVEQLLSSRIGKEFVLRDALEVARTHFDVILIDSPPSVGALALNALVAADQIIIPTTASSLSVEGVNSLVEVLTQVSAYLNPKLDVHGILVTLWDPRTRSLNESMIAALEDAFGGLVFKTRIARNIDVGKAQLQGQTIFDAAPRSRGAEHYRALADEVIARL